MDFSLNDISNRGIKVHDTAEVNFAKDKSFWHNTKKHFSESTAIHGLLYLTKKRTRTEKIIWFISLLASLSGCIYMIYQVLCKYENSPVVVNFATADTPLYEIPFPAVTICPEAKYSREHFDYFKVRIQINNGKTVEANELKKFDYLSLLCNTMANSKMYAYKTVVDEDFYDVIDELKLNFTSMLLFCKYVDEGGTCEQIFTPILTDQGICYSFNIVGRREIFKNNVFRYKAYHHVSHDSRDFFSSDFEYIENAGIHTYPRRALTSGADNSLAIFFNYGGNDTDYSCNSFLKGFRVLIHNPWDLPRLSKHFFRIPFDKVVIAAVEPKLIRTSQTVAKFNSEKRKCYLSYERPLKYFREYSQPNCLLECATNYTLKKCGCVQFYMPRDRGSDTAICGSNSTRCVEDAESKLKIKELELRVSDKSYCDCKPSCTNLQFNVETSHSDFYYKEFFKVRPHPEVKNDGSHWSILQIYFKNEHFIIKERNNLYGISDLISNFGGLLGLFTGFSLISLIDIIYFWSFRIFYNKKLYGFWWGPPK